MNKCWDIHAININLKIKKLKNEVQQCDLQSGHGSGAGTNVVAFKKKLASVWVDDVLLLCNDHQFYSNLQNHGVGQHFVSLTKL